MTLNSKWVQDICCIPWGWEMLVENNLTTLAKNSWIKDNGEVCTDQNQEEN